MSRRRFCAFVAAFSLAAPVRAQSLRGITDADAGKGLRAVLEAGAQAAVRLLGRPDGFLGNPRVRIPLPGYLKDAGRLLGALGQGKQVEELELAMNRAAEQAVPLAGKLLADAVRGMSVRDARDILAGGDTAVTDFFAQKTREPLSAQFLPVVRQQTARVGLKARYEALAQKGVGLGLVRQDDASIDHYVTRKALDALYIVIGEEEKKIRRDPAGSGSALLKKVFGALR